MIAINNISYTKPTVCHPQVLTVTFLIFYSWCRTGMAVTCSVMWAWFGNVRRWGLESSIYEMALSADSPPAAPEEGLDEVAAAASGELRCPICLENFEEKAFTDPCFHILTTL